MCSQGNIIHRRHQRWARRTKKKIMVLEYKRCSFEARKGFEGCTNQARKGKFCKWHGAKVELKRCSVEGCTNHSKRGGVCIRHGAYRNPHDESTACTSCFGSDFDKTTLTRPNQRTPATSASQSSVPKEVVVCKVSANDQVVEV